MFNFLNESLSFLGTGNRNVPGVTGLAGLLIRIVNIIVVLAFAISTLTLAFSFFGFVTSGGDPKAVEKYGKALTWSVIGIVLSGAVFGLKNILLGWLGIENIFL